MNRERLSQIRQAITHNPRGADGYVDELLRACATLLGDCDAARGDRDDTLAVLARVAEQLDVSAEALVEDPTLANRRIVGLLAGGVSEALDSASRAEKERDEARRERDEARAELDEAIEETNRVRVLLNATDGIRDAANAEIGRLRVENKFLRERPIPEGRIHQAMTGYVMDLRALVLDHEWVTDGRECLVYCLWCKQSESNGHAETCEMFGPGGLIPIDPKTKRPAPVKSLRERGCQCQWEAGDSACPVHGEVSL